jgi:hypothetical protein
METMTVASLYRDARGDFEAVTLKQGAAVSRPPNT